MESQLFISYADFSIHSLSHDNPLQLHGGREIFLVACKVFAMLSAPSLNCERRSPAKSGAAMALNHKEQSLNGGTERRASRTEVDRCGT